jgi:segregation and condensation protein A
MIEPVDPELLPTSRPHAEAAEGQPVEAPEEGEDGGGFAVHLERVFHGPLDLLLQLVRDKEMEIHTVSLAEVCDAYCQFIRELPEIDVDEAADYLVIAATLLAIKSRSLLPQDELEADEDPFDPGEELVQQLLAYKELRRVAEELRAGWERRGRLFPAGGRWLGLPPEPEQEDEVQGWEIGEVSVWDLLRHIGRLEEETGFLRPHQVRPVGKPLRVYVEELWLKLQDVAATSYHELLREQKAARGDAAYFLVALLELAKQQQVDLEQVSPFADVTVRRMQDAGALQLDNLDDDFDRQAAQADAEVEELIGEE